MDQPESPKKSYTGRLILFLFLIALSFSGVWLYQNYWKLSDKMPIPITTEPIFVNQQYGFSVAYPPETIPTEITQEPFLYFVSFKESSPSAAIRFTVEVSHNSLEEEVKFIRSQVEGHLAVAPVKQSDITFGVKLEYTPDESTKVKPFTYVVINHKNYSYVINTSTENLDQILATFKFTD